MEAIKDWISLHLTSKSFLSLRTFSKNISKEPVGEEYAGQVSSARANISELTSTSGGASSNTFDNQVNGNPPLQETVSGEGFQSPNHVSGDKMRDPLAKVEALCSEFLHLACHLGHAAENCVVAQVLYRLQLASLIRGGESGIRNGPKIDQAKPVAVTREAYDQPEFKFSIKILLLGKTGVGKSATINSVFDQTKATTDPFEPATDRIEEFVGTVNGIKVTMIDTPGLSASFSSQRQNRKILLSVRRHIKKSPPDVVLYFERLDVLNMGYSDIPLLLLITDVLGFEIWFNTILVLTHCSAAIPEGPDGFPLNYDSFVTWCSRLMQHQIRQAVSDTRLENPVLLVENHPSCKTNIKGEKILPNGQVWRSQLLLLCASSKVLGEANVLLKFKDSFPLRRQASDRMPSLPHLLTSLLHSPSKITLNDMEDDNEILDDYDEDYDELPPINILSKPEFEQLSESQKHAYLDELDYREILFLKKQRKEELRRRKDKMLPKIGPLENDGSNENVASDEVLLPDMTITPSFDSDWPVYRYRCLSGNEQWLTRPILDSQGWDHDVGFDGINLESSMEKGKFHGSIVGQMSKDKQGFIIQTECAGAYMDQEGHEAYAEVDIQNVSQSFLYKVRGDTKLKTTKRNTVGCGFTFVSFESQHFVGGRLEDSLSIGKRFKLRVNTGHMVGLGQGAYGVSIESTLRGKDYPARDDGASITMTFVSFDKEMVLGGRIHSDFHLKRNLRMAASMDLNSRKMGKLSLRASSCEHFQIALVAVVPILRALFRKRPVYDNSSS